MWRLHKKIVHDGLQVRHTAELVEEKGGGGEKVADAAPAAGHGCGLAAGCKGKRATDTRSPTCVVCRRRWHVGCMTLAMASMHDNGDGVVCDGCVAPK